MKKMILIILLSGCTPSYSKLELDDKVITIVNGVNATYGVAMATAKKVFAKEIERCNKEKKIYDLESGNCLEKKEPAK